MTNRYTPNEAACPVELELLGLLLRSPEARVLEIVEGQERSQRAALAAFCFQRSHMRDMSLLIASKCEERDLLIAGGPIGEMLIEQSRALVSKPKARKSRITLARAA